MGTPDPRDIDVILRHHFPAKGMYDALERWMPAQRALLEEQPEHAEMAAMKARLLAQSAEEVGRQADEVRAKSAQAERDKIAAAEKARFFNQPSASANFDFWLKVETWTVDEAAALLLGRDPSAVNPATLTAELQAKRGMFQQPIAPTRFHESFAQLRLLMSRATSLPKPNLKPADVVTWARRTTGVPLPAALDGRFPLIAQPEDASPESSQQTDIVLVDGIDIGRKGDPKRWTDARKQVLRAFVAKQGARKAADVWQISEQRVRQLIQDDAPEATKPASVFNYRHQ